MAAGEFRARICYAKIGRLRYLSHLEVSHALDRAVRRAGLPYAVTRGFNPHMKVAFGPALPTGTAGEREYVDIWLTEFIEPARVLASIAGSLPPELSPVEVRYVSMHAPSLASECTIAMYTAIVREEGVAPESLQQALDELVSGGEMVVEHKGKTKVFDLARCLPKEPHVRSPECGPVVDLTIRMGPEGSLRPDVLIAHSLRATESRSAVTFVTRRDTFIESDEGWRRPI